MACLGTCFVGVLLYNDRTIFSQLTLFLHFRNNSVGAFQAVRHRSRLLVRENCLSDNGNENGEAKSVFSKNLAAFLQVGKSDAHKGQDEESDSAPEDEFPIISIRGVVVALIGIVGLPSVWPCSDII